MKLRLTGIYEENRFPPTYASSGSAPAIMPPPSQKVVIAQLQHMPSSPLEIHLNVPGELVGDAKIGDEFTLHLERVKK